MLTFLVFNDYETAPLQNRQSQLYFLPEMPKCKSCCVQLCLSIAPNSHSHLYYVMFMLHLVHLLHLCRCSLNRDYHYKCHMIVLFVSDYLPVYFNLYQFVIHTSSNACICILKIIVFVISQFDNG